MEDNPFFAGGKWLSAVKKPWSRASLPSLEGLHVWVSLLEEEARQDGLDRNRLKAEVEWRLAMAGIPVCHRKAGSRVPPFPCLGVLLSLRKAYATPPFYTFSVEVFFVQSHCSEEQPATHCMQMTWCQEAIGDAPVTSQGADWSGLLGQVSYMVDAFIRDYQAVHPPCRRSFLIN